MCRSSTHWWQTETGGIMITPLPGATAMKPGSATRPFFGIEPVVLNDQGQEQTETATEGVLCIKESWPGQMRTVYGDHDRFVSTYFEMYKGYYFSGDGCRRDSQMGITGSQAASTMSSTSPATVWAPLRWNRALVAHPKVSEAAVVGYPHPRSRARASTPM